MTAALVAVGLALSLVPGLQHMSEHAAARFVDRHAYVGHVLHHVPVQRLPSVPLTVPAASGASIAYGLGALALTVAATLFGLYRRRIPEGLRAAAARFVEPPVAGLKAAHSGVVGDYVMWLAVGTAVLGGVWLITLRAGF